MALTTTQSTNPLVTPVWRSGEYFAKALWRLLLLLLVKLNRQTGLELKVCPSASDVLGKLVVIRVQVFVMLGIRLAGVNIGDSPHQAMALLYSADVSNTAARRVFTNRYTANRFRRGNQTVLIGNGIYIYIYICIYIYFLHLYT